MKTAQELYESMLRVFREKTGYNVSDSCDLSVRLYALAAELESLYAYADFAAQQAFPQTAVGEHLDLHGAMRNLTRKPGSAAAGVLRLSVEEVHAADIIVPAGSIFSTAEGIQYETDDNVVIPAGSRTADAAATCTTLGEAGNTAAGTVCNLTHAPYAVAAVTNPAAMTGGVDAESDAAFRERILLSYSRLPNGANAAYYETVVMRHPDVVACKVMPCFEGVGTVGIYVAAKEGIPDGALLQAVQAELIRLREISVRALVLQPKAVSVNVKAQVWPAPGVSDDAAIAAAKEAISDYFTGHLLCQPVYRSTLGNLLYKTGKIANYVITEPTADIQGQDGRLPVLGTLQVTKGA